MLLQNTSTQRAIAAMQLASSKARGSNEDADVAAESAALQRRCRSWIRSQEVLHKSLVPPEYGMQGCTKQPQQVQGNTQQPQGMLCSTFFLCLTGLQNLCFQNICFRADHKGDHVNKPQGSSSVACQSGDAGVPAVISTNGREDFSQNGANSCRDAASDAASANALANGGGNKDVAHLRASSAYPAATEKLTQADVSAVTHHDLSELQGTCTSADSDAVGDDRCVCPGDLSHTLQQPS